MARLLLVCMFVLLSACRADITYRVLLVGDSLADGAEPAIRRKLIMSDEAGFAMLPNPIPGTGFAHLEIGEQYWMDRGAALFALAPFDGVVVSLGTNDASVNANPEKRASLAYMRSAAARFMAFYGANGRQVFWLLPHTLTPDNYRQEVVAAIQLAAADFPQVHLVDAEAIAAVRGIAFGSLLQPDNVHYNDAGNALLAEVVHTTLVADSRARGLDK